MVDPPMRRSLSPPVLPIISSASLRCSAISRTLGQEQTSEQVGFTALQRSRQVAAARYHDIGAGDIARRVRTQQQGCPYHFVRFRCPSNGRRRFRLDIAPHFLILSSPSISLRRDEPG